jgi:hypothetical protein
MRNARVAVVVTMGILLTLAACNKTGTSSDGSAASSGAAATSSGGSGSGSGATASSGGGSSASTVSAPAPITIPEGKTLTVTIDQSVTTKTNAAGDRVDASLAEPVTVDGNEVLPKGTHVRGTVVTSEQAGHIKGGATLTIRLASISLNGQTYDIHTSSFTETSKARGKRTAIGAGGGAAVGAVIGALAGGGKGAAIGAAAGGGAGTAGAAYTGDRDATIPAETVVHFKLTQPVTLSQ